MRSFESRSVPRSGHIARGVSDLTTPQDRQGPWMLEPTTYKMGQSGRCSGHHAGDRLLTCGAVSPTTNRYFQERRGGFGSPHSLQAGPTWRGFRRCKEAVPGRPTVLPPQPDRTGASIGSGRPARGFLGQEDAERLALKVEEFMGHLPTSSDPGSCSTPG